MLPLSPRPEYQAVLSPVCKCW